MKKMADTTTIAPWAVMAGGFLIGVGSGIANQLVGYFFEVYGKHKLNKILESLLKIQQKEDEVHKRYEKRLDRIEKALMIKGKVR